jgi:hypothetical protein
VLRQTRLRKGAAIAAFALLLIGCSGDESNDATPTSPASTSSSSNGLDRVVKIDGDTIMFEPEIPDRCSTFRCLWSVAVAHPGQRWRRVS